jgi:colanic acid/amylovoran biosynthesis glycosyltransferase
MFFRLLAKNPKAAFEALRFLKYRTVSKNLKLLWFGNAFAGEHYDVVHCHFGMNGLIGVYLKECGFCDAVITSFHGSDINSYPKRHGADVYKTLYAKGDLVTSNTNFTKDKIVANGCAESAIRIVPECLIADEYLAIDRSRAWPDTILTVGRLEEKKGHRYALEAIARVRKVRPNVQYYMAGDGTLMADLKSRAAELGIADCCHFLGLCDGGQVRELYATCSVFTLPSVTASNGDMEGQGLVIQEAQMCGLPVVTTWHNGIPDGLIDGTTGYLVHERDVDALAARLVELLSDDALRARMGAAGREFVAGKYDIGVITKNLTEYYHEVSKQ